MSTPLEIAMRNVSWILVYTITWEVDQTNSDLLYSSIIADKKWMKVIIDLSRLNYANSWFLWFLMSLFWTIEDDWWKMVISWCQSHIKDILDLAWVFEIVKSFDTNELALAHLSRK